MPGLPFGSNAFFSDNVLSVMLRDQMLRISTAPFVQARNLRLQTDSWTDCFPRLPLDRIFRVLDATPIIPDDPFCKECDAAFLPPSTKKYEVETIDAYREFIGAVGADLSREVSQLGSLHYTTLFYATRVPLLMRRLQANPGLIFALLASARKQQNTINGLDFVEQMVDQKESVIATQLRFPPGAWRILKRVMPAALHRKSMKRLRKALKSGGKLRTARHLPRLGVNVLKLLSDDSRTGQPVFNRISHRLLHEIAEQESPTERKPNIASRIISVLDAHDYVFPASPMQIASLEHVDRLYDRYHAVVKPCGRLRLLGGMNGFPTPPIPGDDCIIPIHKVEDLLRESIAQSNCCYNDDYVRSIMRRERYFYSVQGGGFGRLTVEIISQDQGDRTIWRLGEVRGPRNQSPHRSPRTLECLAVWLADYQRVEDGSVLPVYHPLAHDHSSLETEEESEQAFGDDRAYPLFNELTHDLVGTRF